MLDIFENEEYLSLVMECMEGGDLFDYQDRRDFKLSDRHCSEIAHKLAAALYYLHSYGIAHRDLKPENILMQNDLRDSDVKLSDFGLSKFLGPDEHAKEQFGTLSYAAPEVILKVEYGMEIDLWSYGVIVFSLVTGGLPFDSETDKQTARNIAKGVINWKKAENISDESRDVITSTLP